MSSAIFEPEPEPADLGCAKRLRALADLLAQGRPLPDMSEGHARELADCLRRAADRLAPQPASEQDRAQASPSPAYGGQAPEEALLNCDGASRGNPGPAGAGAVLSSLDEKPFAFLKRYLGHTTNNQAEYQALILGLSEARDRGIKRLTVRLDSELIVKQINGIYRVKNPGIKPLYEQARQLLAGFEQVRVMHVRRHLNSLADQMANKAIDDQA
jgi:ribonuclease HI